MSQPSDSATSGVRSGRVDMENLSISFALPRGDTLVAVEDVNVVLEPGSFTALIGPSGCGKSTILNAIAGFVPISGGTIKIDGEPVAGINPEVGVVFQQYALFPWFSAIGNVEFALKRLGLPKSERRERALEALREVGLEERAKTFPGELSGGMKQRVALARTFASEPKVLLMDEPFGALDPITRAHLQEEFVQLMAKVNKTVLMVTHDLAEAFELGDRVSVMHDGSLLQTGTQAELTLRPASQFVADFVSGHVAGANDAPL